jgi:hypothetical protein
MPSRVPPNELQGPFFQLAHSTAVTAPLAALEICSFLHETVHDLRALAVARARANGHSWRTIAAALDMPPQTCRRKFSPIEPTTTRSSR